MNENLTPKNFNEKIQRLNPQEPKPIPKLAN